MKNYKEDTEPYNDPMAADDTYDEYAGPDLSGDPMAAGEERKSRRMRRREEKYLREQQQLEQQRAALKAEILAEMEAEKQSGSQSGEAESPAEDTPPPRRRGRFAEYLMAFLSGNILSKSEMRKVYPYLLFVAFLAFLYIGNVFRIQSLYRQQEKLTQQVGELRAKSLTIAAQKMNATRQSSIMAEIERRGIPLRESLTPNRVIEE